MYPRRKFSDTISFKILFLVVLTLVLLIPGAIITGVIDERDERQNETVQNISDQWGYPQTVTGPMLVIPYRKSETKKDSIGFVTILPSVMNYDAKLESQTLRRGIYEDVVYSSKIVIDGTFDLSTLQPTDVPLSALILSQAKVQLGVRDLRGIEKVSDFTLGERGYELSGNHGEASYDLSYVDEYESGYYKESEYEVVMIDDAYDSDVPGVRGSFLGAKVDIDSLIGRKNVTYACSMDLKGSHAMSVAPVGKTTEITISGDCASPSFSGMFLPSDREIADGKFSAVWNLNAVNRDYPQVYTGEFGYSISQSAVTASLLVPVDRYQKTERSVKYAVLVILLTFIGVLFAETILKHRIYVFQYLLVGLALVLFYSLLLSLTEHISFGMSYCIAAVMTIGLVGLYMRGVLRNTRVAGYISLLLTIIYAYIFVLLNLETFALLAGSIGLFIALAAIMFASLKMDWKSV
ncbi:MAG: cell envelope integrity protein CreD [Muribaculaceae bacterium]|nr:cell envelope integrity protein CreD [Muribaculaceae bacterium]